MPLLLTTPINTGDLAAVNYDRVMVTQFSLFPNEKRIDFKVEYGTIPASEWVPASHNPEGLNTDFSVRNYGDDGGATAGAGTDYDDMIAKLPVDANEKIYDGASRVLYQWLIDKGHFVGTIE